MSKNNIAIAFNGQFKNDLSSAKYVYPKNETDWRKKIDGETRTVPSDLRVEKCYTIKIIENGIIYAYRELTKNRAGGDCLMVMIFSPGPTTNPEELTKCLQELLDYAKSKSSEVEILDDVVNDKIKAIEGLEIFDFTRKPVVFQDKSNEPTLKKHGYRVYKNDTELFTILSNPFQPVYEKYDCIHIVSAEVDPISSNKIELIKEPLKKIYYFKFPDNVYEENGKEYVLEGDCFTLVYKKNDYENFETEELSSNVPQSNYFIIENNLIKVRNAEECNIPFCRKIRIVIKDKNDRKIENVNIEVEGQKKQTVTKNQDGSYTLKLSNGSYNCSIKAENYNYETLKIEVKENATDTYKVILKAKRDSATLKFKIPFQKKEKFSETEVKIEYDANTMFGKIYKKELKYKNSIFYIFSEQKFNMVKWISILSLLLSIGIGVGLGWFIRKKDTTKQTEVPILNNPESEESGNSDSSEGPNVSMDGEEKLSEKELEPRDVKYLNENDTWCRDSLKSKKYQYFFETILLNKIQWSENRDIINEKSEGISNEGWVKYKEIYDKDKSKFRNVKKKIENAVGDSNKFTWEEVLKEETKIKKTGDKRSTKDKDNYSDVSRTNKQDNLVSDYGNPYEQKQTPPSEE